MDTPQSLDAAAAQQLLSSFLDNQGLRPLPPLRSPTASAIGSQVAQGFSEASGSGTPASDVSPVVSDEAPHPGAGVRSGVVTSEPSWVGVTGDGSVSPRTLKLIQQLEDDDALAARMQADEVSVAGYTAAAVGLSSATETSKPLSLESTQVGMLSPSGEIQQHQPFEGDVTGSPTDMVSSSSALVDVISSSAAAMEREVSVSASVAGGSAAVDGVASSDMSDLLAILHLPVTSVTSSSRDITPPRASPQAQQSVQKSKPRPYRPPMTSPPVSVPLQVKLEVHNSLHPVRTNNRYCIRCAHQRADFLALPCMHFALCVGCQAAAEAASDSYQICEECSKPVRILQRIYH